jgi:hypothetical protein
VAWSTGGNPHATLRVSGLNQWYPRERRCGFARTGQLHPAAADGPIGPGSHQPGAHAPGRGRRARGQGLGGVRRAAEVLGHAEVERVERLQAPVKGFCTFERSADSPIFEEPRKAQAIMREDVLPGANSLADRARDEEAASG